MILLQSKIQRVASNSIFILAILMLSWLFITFNIANDSLWQNEIVSHFRATRPTLTDTYTEIANDDSAPLHEIVFLRPWLQLGDNEFFIRLPSAFFSLLAICLVFRFAIETFDKQTALFAIILYATNPIQLYYAREGRMYALLALMTFAWVYFLFRIIRTDGKKWGDLVGYAIFAAASVYTHYYGGIALLSSALFMAGYLVKTQNFELGKRWLLTNIGAAVLFLPWIPTFLFQLGNDPISSLRVPTFAKFGKMTGQIFVGFYWLPSSLEWLLSLGVLGIIAVSFAILWYKNESTSTQFASALHLFVIFGFSITAAFVLSKLITPMFVIRYFSGVVPILIILVAFGISNLKFPPIVFGLFLCILASNLFFSQHVLTTVWRKDFKSAMQIIDTHTLESSGETDQLVFYSSPGGKFWIDEFDHYYIAPYPVTYWSGQPLDMTLVNDELDQLDRADGVWIIQSNEAHLVHSISLKDSSEYEVTFEQDFASYFFYSQRLLKISYLEHVE